MLKPPVILVPRAGLLDTVARRLFAQVDCRAFAAATCELPYGDWKMRDGRAYFTLSGLRKLARTLEVDLEFEPESAKPSPRPLTWIEASLGPQN